jgi:heat shock protein HslJ
MTSLVRTPTVSRHRLATAVAGVALALFLSACSTTANDTKSSTYGVPNIMENLTANQWVVNPAESNLPPSTAGTTITFTTSGTLSGAGPCNSYGGDFTIDGATITISAVHTTLKACDPGIMSAEHLYLQALESAHSVSPTNRDQLKLTGGLHHVLVYDARVSRKPPKG